jgi:hypothetical protein
MITYGLIVNQGQLNKLFNRMDHASVLKVLRPPMEASLLDLHDDLTDYPPPSSGKTRFKTARQRRYFFWALRTGVIQVPYVRTGKLGQSWTWKITTTGSGLRGEDGTNIPHAHWVQREESQARIHRGNWLTDMGALDKNREQIGRRFRNAIMASLASGSSGG